jgi:hypothetical protein
MRLCENIFFLAFGLMAITNNGARHVNFDTEVDH